MRIFTSAIAAIALTLGVASAEPTTFTLDKSHVNVLFEVNHIGFSQSRGVFKNLDATLTLDDAAPNASKLDVTIDTTSLDTFWDARTTHVKGPDFFDVAKFPTARFVSTKVERTGPTTAKVTGDLTLKGVTKPVTLDVTTSGVKPHPRRQTPTVGFLATGTFKRSEFGISYGVPGVGDEVKLTIDAEFTGPAPAAPAAPAPAKKK